MVAEDVQKYELKPNTTLVTLYARTPALVKIWMTLAGDLYLKPFQSFRIFCSRQDCQIPRLSRFDQQKKGVSKQRQKLHGIRKNQIRNNEHRLGDHGFEKRDGMGVCF